MSISEQKINKTKNEAEAKHSDVSFERVGFRYHRESEVLSDISFELKRGSMNFITGASGAGKTTLLKLVYLHMRPSRGIIKVFGQDISTLGKNEIPALKRRMGIVLQDFRLIEHLSVYENVALPLRIANQSIGNKFRTKHVTDYNDDLISLLKWVGLGEKINVLPATLSGGEKQRAAIARAIITKPEILIADEPTGNVDIEMGVRLMRLFSELNRLGTTILIATHNENLIPDNANIFRLDNAHLSLERGGI